MYHSSRLTKTLRILLKPQQLPPKIVPHPRERRFQLQVEIPRPHAEVVVRRWLRDPLRQADDKRAESRYDHGKCGRFFIKLYGQLVEAFGVADAPLFERSNIVPGQTVPVVLQDDDTR